MGAARGTADQGPEREPRASGPALRAENHGVAPVRSRESRELRRGVATEDGVARRESVLRAWALRPRLATGVGKADLRRVESEIPEYPNVFLVEST
jgi:hypothetical protein